MITLVRQLPYDHPYRWDGREFGKPQLWRPSALPSLALWLDAEDTATITLNATTVAQWADKSGNARNYTQPVAASQPLYAATGFNGKATIQNVSADLLELNASALGRNVSGITVAIVGLHPVGATFATNGADYFIGTGTALTRFTLQPNVGSNLFAIGGRRLDTDAFASVQSTTDALAFRGNPWIRVGQRNYAAGVGNHYTNGTQDMTNATFGTQGAGNTSDTNAAISTIFNAASPNGMQMSEIVVTHSAANDTDRQKLEGYLAWKWGLENNLPSTHPFRRMPPTL